METNELFKSLIITNFPIPLKKQMQEKKLKDKISYATQIRLAVKFWLESEGKNSG